MAAAATTSPGLSVLTSKKLSQSYILEDRMFLRNVPLDNFSSCEDHRMYLCKPRCYGSTNAGGLRVQAKNVLGLGV
jgi:hypothetical protein